MCWILPGISSFLNFGGNPCCLWGIWRSPRTSTSTITFLHLKNSLPLHKSFTRSPAIRKLFEKRLQKRTNFLDISLVLAFLGWLRVPLALAAPAALRGWVEISELPCQCACAYLLSPWQLPSLCVVSDRTDRRRQLQAKNKRAAHAVSKIVDTKECMQ